MLHDTAKPAPCLKRVVMAFYIIRLRKDFWSGLRRKVPIFREIPPALYILLLFHEEGRRSCRRRLRHGKPLRLPEVP